MSKQHEPATAIVRAIRASETRCLFIKAMMRITGLSRVKVEGAVKFLAARRLVEHCERGCYRLTDAGHAAIEPGVFKSKTGVASGPTAQQTRGATGVRAAAWRALRIKYVVTLNEVCSLIDTGAEANVRERVRLYFRPLVNAGVLATKRTRGGVQYVLVQNLGPLAPIVGRQGVFDANAKAFVAPEAAQ